MIVDLTSENFEQETSKGMTLVDFWATWCGPCRMQGKIIDDFAAALNSMNVKVGKVNVDEQADLAAKFGVVSIPTLVFIKDGDVKKTVVGVHNQVALKELLEEVF